MISELLICGKIVFGLTVALVYDYQNPKVFTGIKNDKHIIHDKMRDESIFLYSV